MLAQVRALQGSGWQRDAQHFAAYAEAIGKLAEAQLEGVQGGYLAPRDLSSVRMLLRATLKQVKGCAELATLLHRHLRSLTSVESGTPSDNCCSDTFVAACAGG